MSEIYTRAIQPQKPQTKANKNDDNNTAAS